MDKYTTVLNVFSIVFTILVGLALIFSILLFLGFLVSVIYRVFVKHKQPFSAFYESMNTLFSALASFLFAVVLFIIYILLLNINTCINKLSKHLTSSSAVIYLIVVFVVAILLSVVLIAIITIMKSKHNHDKDIKQILDTCKEECKDITKK